MAELGKIDVISNYFLSLDQGILHDILQRLEAGEAMKPSTEERLLQDLDRP